MSLATRCTHCGTIFKVVQDQLKVSEGWVRCGRCNEVFNALPALFDLDKEPPPPRPAHAAQPASQASAQAPENVPEGDPPAPAASEPQAEVSEAMGEAAIAEAPQPSAVPEPEPQALRAPASNPTAHFDALPEDEAPLASQDLLSEEELDLGLESQPPGGWASTQPVDFDHTHPPREAAERPLAEDDLALDPPPIESATDFELDTSIAVDDNTPLEAVIAAMSGNRFPPPSAAASPAAAMAHTGATPPPAHTQPWLDEPPEDLPTTDEADALDSRYLMPSERERRAPRRRDNGPEFADAQFPSDAMLDAEEDWASDFGSSSLENDLPPEPSPAADPVAPPVTTTALRKAEGAAFPAPPSAAPSARNTGDNAENEPENNTALDALPGETAIVTDEVLTPPKDRPSRFGRRRATDEQTPEFLKRAQRQAFWRHPAMRGLMSVAALALLLGLGLQLVHQFRDLVAAYHPASRPLLTQWCEAVGCTLSPPLRLEALQVDNLELVRTSSEGPDSYRLTVVVRNQAAIDLAWPHIDLTLTDDNGAVIARRVFSPHDAQWLDTADAKADAAHAASAASVPTAAPSQRSTTLQWRLRSSDLKPAGYTAELFYP